MAGGYENEDRMAELEELRREKEREARQRVEWERRQQEAQAGEVPKPVSNPGQSKTMAAAPDPKLNVKRASDDKAQQDKLALLKELAKMTKPTGPSSRGEEDKS